MASTDFITASPRKIRIGDTEANRPNSESINNKIGGSINFLIDRQAKDEDFVIPGYFNANDYDDGAAGIRYIERDADIDLYYMAIRDTGSSGTNSFNIAVYDNTGAFVNNLFGSGGNALQISGNNGQNVLAGRKDLTTVTPGNILINTAGHTIQQGNLQLTTLLAGYVLVPFIVSNGKTAINMQFKLRLKEL